MTRGPGNTIIKEICGEHGISLGQFFGYCRPHPIVVARQKAYARMYSELGYTYSMIGRICNRDHSTILYGIRAHKKRTSNG